GRLAGASLANKPGVTLSATNATPGYTPQELAPGEWVILVGACLVAPEGVQLTLTLTFTPKKLRLLKGDLHVHTLASDGTLPVEELARHALRHGLDFLGITDHNLVATSQGLPRVPGITLIPGVEWSHSRLHAGFLGVDQPYDEPFLTATLAEAKPTFESARARGALITLNHPYREPYDFEAGLPDLPWDCLEVWNGRMRDSNLQAIALWQRLLTAGRHVPLCAGSDYHRDSVYLIIGSPTLGVYARSAGPADILAAIKTGQAYAVFGPDGPSVELSAGQAVMGGSVRWEEFRELEITLDGLQAGDAVRVVTANNTVTLLEAPANGSWRGSCVMTAPGFARVEVLRAAYRGLPQLPALLSNPVWFEG
ncbi:MAG: CehA/McbA family metallohydrolase, partial [Anaerolineae bacterium]